MTSLTAAPLTVATAEDSALLRQGLARILRRRTLTKTCEQSCRSAGLPAIFAVPTAVATQ
jgi:hypothetical protein